MLLELFLQLGNFINNKFYLPKNLVTNFEENSCKIICFSDSFTYGIGADYQNSYPAQMENILNKNGKEREFKVLNFGTPSINSTMMLLKLRNSLKKINPAMEQVTEQYNIVLVDHRPDFNKLLEQSPKSNYFASDHKHCTKEGYRVIAENIEEEISKFLGKN